MANIEEYRRLITRLKNKDYSGDLERCYLADNIEKMSKDIKDRMEQGYARQEKVKLILSGIGFKGSNKAIFRIADGAIKDWDSVDRLEKHMLRACLVPNANHELSEYNLILKGEDSLGMTIENYYIKYNMKVHKNGRICTELLYSMSPATFYKPGTDELDFKLIEKWCTVVMNYAEAQFPDGQLVWAQLHMDESSPHIHIFVVGRTFHQKYQKFVPSHKKFFGDKVQLRNLQTSYANALQRHGFVVSRGLENSTATHVTVARWRARQAKIDEELAYKNKIINKKEKEKKEEIEKLNEKFEIEKKARNKLIRELIDTLDLDPEYVGEKLSKYEKELNTDIKREENRSKELKSSFKLEKKIEDDR